MGVEVEVPVADVAGRLRAAREEAGLTIEDLSARTKIKPSILRAIEQGAFEQLPGGEFFTRAFLRTYARELHLPVDEVMADYDSAHPPATAGPEPLPGSQHHTVDEPESGYGGWSLAAVVLAGLLVVFFMMRTSPPADRQPEAIGTTGTIAAAPSGAPAPVNRASDASPPDSLTIEIRPTRQLWVTGMADGKRVLFRMLEPGEEVTIEARETMSFRLGDAGAFHYALNGVPGKPPGRDGEVREFTINRGSHRELAR